MFLFGKKEKEEEVAVKDLKPKNKRARKEPVKPWGRGERILILIVLGLTVGISAILGAIARGGLDFPAFSGTGPALPNFSFDQTFVFERKTDGCCEKVILDFKDLTDGLSGTYGFAVTRLDGSGEYGLNQNDIFKAASLIKLPAAVALYAEAERGNLDLDSVYVLKDSDKVDGNGSLINYPAGSAFTFRTLAKFALAESDNTAFNIFENYLGDRRIQEAITSLGMKSTSIYDNTTAPKDIALLIKALKDASYLNEKDSREILTYMQNSDFDSWLVAGVSKGVEVAHKYGKEVGAVNDAGIIYAKNPYVVVILSKDADEAEADRVFPELSKAIYDFESSR